MADTADFAPSASTQTVRDPRTGQSVIVRGVGALKGQLALKKTIDLTKPIASQALKGRKSAPKRKP